MHRLLEQQIQKHVKDSTLLQSLDDFIRTVDESYSKADQDLGRLKGSSEGEVASGYSSQQLNGAFLEAAWEASADAFLCLDTDNNVVRFNQRFLSLWGILPSAATDANPTKLIEFAVDQVRDPQEFWHCIRSKAVETLSTELTMLLELTNGDNLALIVGPIEEPDTGKFMGRLCVFREITEIRRNEILPRHVGMHDRLTGLPNRLLFNDRLEHAIHRAERVEKHLALCRIDIDGFKAINEAEGHAVGNKILHAVTDRIQCCIRSQETLARFGGDDFVVLSEDLEEPREAVRLAGRISQAFQRPFIIGGEEVYLSACMGMALYPIDSEDPRELIAQSREALSDARAKSKGTISLYNQTLEGMLTRRRTMLRELAHAIDNDELFLMFQPKSDISSEKIVGFEALVRWEHPENGLMNPSDFIPVAEESPIIFDLSRWVLDQACKQLNEWQKAGCPQVPVSLNLSIQELQAPNLCDSFYEVVRKNGIEPDLIEIEVSEGILIDHLEEGTATLQALREVGFSVAVDNFGMGHSTMGILKNLPIDKIKIDRAFIRNMSKSKKDAAITDSIVTLGHNLGLIVVAEGVEDFASMESLQSFECDQLQGYFFSAPLQGEELMTFIQNHK